MPVPVTTLYAGLNGLIALTLATLVIRQRQRTGTVLGAGGDAALEQAIRAHGNFVEYVPLILVLMLLLELGGVSAPWLHGMGIALTAARVLHGWGLARSRNRSFGRAAGFTVTWLILAAAAAAAVVLGARAL